MVLYDWSLSSITMYNYPGIDITNALDNRKYCAALFIYLSKAFDTVDHAILLGKLSLIGLGSDACHWFHDYLKDRSEAVSRRHPVGAIGVG